MRHWWATTSRSWRSRPGRLAEYLRDHGLRRVAKRLATSGVIEVVATAAPGIDDIVVLGKIKQLEQSGNYDLIVVDGPAAGHAITFLMAPANLLKLVRGGPIRSQAADVAELLADPARSQVILVTLPETTPVNEVIETADALVDVPGCGWVRSSSTPTTRATTCRSMVPRRPPLRCGRVPQRSAALHRRETHRLAEVLELEQSVCRWSRPVSTGATSGSQAWDDTVTDLDDLISDADVVVCCGSGGVGKTTTAAALGLQAARNGRRCVVVTIDPAKRLADALGVPGGLNNDPTRLDLDDRRFRGAVGVDARHGDATFDGLVTANARAPSRRRGS